MYHKLAITIVNKNRTNGSSVVIVGTIEEISNKYLNIGGNVRIKISGSNITNSATFNSLML
jgi:hypothetical protein